METLFYSEDCLVELLNESAGEKVVCIGLKQDKDGNLLIYRHINLNSLKFIDSYTFSNGELVSEGHSPINIQLSHRIYTDSYDVVIEN